MERKGKNPQPSKRIHGETTKPEYVGSGNDASAHDVGLNMPAYLLCTSQGTAPLCTTLTLTISAGAVVFSVQ